MMNKFLCNIAVFVLLAIGMTSCFPPAERVPPIASVGVVFPIDGDNIHWQQEQVAMIDYLTALNFAVYLSYAQDGDAELQAKHIKQMQDWGVQYIVFASVDTYSTKINEALDAYVLAGGRVICYDRLQQNTDAISVYVSSSYKTIGELQIAAFDYLSDRAKIEMVSGPSYDVNARTMFKSADEVVSYKLALGSWTCPSGRVTYEQTKMDNWGEDAAYEYMKELLKNHYPEQTLPDAILVANDTQAAGVAQAIADVNPKLTKYPIITGLDYTEAALIRIVNDKQTMTVYKDVKQFIIESAQLLVKMVNKTPILTKQSISNGTIEVPYIEVGGLKAIYKKDILKQ